MKNPKLFSIDWLQLFCSHDTSQVLEAGTCITSPRCDMYGEHRTYRLVGAREYLHGYRQQLTVMWKQYTVATISYDHVDERVDRHACAIKLANAVLYVADWRYIVEDIMAALGWVPRNITRVDLCCDFNKFDYGIDPRTFMRRYLSDRSAKLETYVRVASNKFAVNGTKTPDAALIETIRWGSRQNGVSTYMYNKSLELKSHNYKKYIVNAWRAAGLIIDDPKHPIYRVEFSICSKGVALQDLELGEMHTLWLDDFDDAQRVRSLFQTFAAKFFRFKIVPPIGERLVKKQNLRDLELFDYSERLPMWPRTLCRTVDSGRTERMIASRLAQLSADLDQYRLLGSDAMCESASLLQRTAEVFDEVADIKHYRRAFDIHDEIDPTHRLDENYKAALMEARRRDRLAQHTARQLAYDFLSRQESKIHKSLKINKLGGGDVFTNLTPASQKGGDK